MVVVVVVVVVVVGVVVVLVVVGVAVVVVGALVVAVGLVVVVVAGFSDVVVAVVLQPLRKRPREMGNITLIRAKCYSYGEFSPVSEK